MTVHKPVLLKESIESLKLKKGATVVDATLGGGGHSGAIAEAIGKSGILVAIDADSEAIEKFKAQSAKFKDKGKIFLVNDNFSNVQNILADLKIEKVDAILADFGISSDQLESERGFSFQKDAPLDMRMSQTGARTAENVVNEYSEKELVRIFKEYGEEKYARKIAQNIIAYRQKKPIGRTPELVSIIESAVPENYRHQRIHPATKVFQALRIEVNEELDSIGTFISQAIDSLRANGRLAVITFHSGEDAIVKNMFRENARGCICPSTLPVCVCGKKPSVRVITKKPIVPSGGEIGENPRARSAKLRVIEKI